jgi:heat shock protein HslJ
VIALAVAGIAIGACDESPTSPSELIGQTWRLLSIDRSGLPSNPAPSDRRFTIAFQDGGRLAVRADCNSCSGTYDLSRSQFNIRPLACTRAFCGNDSLDTPFLQALSDARSARIDGSELTIRADSVTLRFTRQ